MKDSKIIFQYVIPAFIVPLHHQDQNVHTHQEPEQKIYEVSIMQSSGTIMLSSYYNASESILDSASKSNIQKFELTKDGVKPIILVFDSLTAPTIYKKTLNWVQETYKNPSEVLKTNIENEKIRVDGIKKNVWFYKGMGMKIFYDVEYSFYVEFKDGKAKLSFTFGNTWNEGKSSYVDYTKIYKENGDVYSMYKETKPGMELMMNELALSFFKYVKEVKKSDW